jgi:transcription antitermination factor NusG
MSMLSGNSEALRSSNPVIGVVDAAALPQAQHWYAIYTRSCQEAQIEKHFAVRGIESFLPQYYVVKSWKNRCTKKLARPLFPGYIFTHINPLERIRVLEIPGVVSLVGAAGRPMPLSDVEIDALREGLHARKAEPHPFLKVGRRARIRGGALAGMEGVVVRDKNCSRIVISLDLIMRSIAVEVDWDELEPIAHASSRACESRIKTLTE